MSPPWAHRGGPSGKGGPNPAAYRAAPSEGATRCPPHPAECHPSAAESHSQISEHTQEVLVQPASCSCFQNFLCLPLPQPRPSSPPIITWTAAQVSPLERGLLGPPGTPLSCVFSHSAHPRRKGPTSSRSPCAEHQAPGVPLSGSLRPQGLEVLTDSYTPFGVNIEPRPPGPPHSRPVCCRHIQSLPLSL